MKPIRAALPKKGNRDARKGIGNEGQSGVSSSPLVASYLPEISKPYAEGIISGAIGAATIVFAEPILHALAWSEVLVGNLMSAVAMGGYLWHRHPNLKIRP